MAVDTEYLDNLMKSIEPVVYPDGVPKEYADGEEELFGEDENYQDEYAKELDSIAEKNTEAVTQEQSTVETKETSDISVNSNEQDKSASNEEDEPLEELELDLSMSEEEIDALLNSAKNVPKEENNTSSEDVTDILSLFGDDEGMADIKETLEKADNNIAVDSKALDEPEIKIPGLDDEDDTADENIKGSKKKKKEKKAKRPKKEKNTDSESGDTETVKEKKPGLFTRIIASLTEEAEDGDIAVPESSETGITDENAKILAELDSEENVKDKKKKKKKDKKEKKGKGSKDASEGEGSEKDIREKSDDEDAGGTSEKGKKKKPKKEKKAKKPKEEEENTKPSKKLPKKRVRNTFILCISILAAIILLSIFGGEYNTKKNARYAFDNQEYATTYSDLYGMKLNEEDELIYTKSKIILLLSRKADSYENYMRLGMKPEALNALLEGYEMSAKVKEAAEEYDVTAQVMQEYTRIVDGLAVFGLSEDDARQLASLDSDVEYNRQVRAIASGSTYQIDMEENTNNTNDTQGFEDVLPEELDFLPDNAEDL